MKTNNTARNRRKLINKLDGVNEVLRQAEQFIKDHQPEQHLTNLHSIRHAVVQLQETILHL